MSDEINTGVIGNASDLPNNEKDAADDFLGSSIARTFSKKIDLKSSFDLQMLDTVKEEKFEGEIGIPSVGSN